MITLKKCINNVLNNTEELKKQEIQDIKINTEQINDYDLLNFINIAQCNDKKFTTDYLILITLTIKTNEDNYKLPVFLPFTNKKDKQAALKEIKEYKYEV